MNEPSVRPDLLQNYDTYYRDGDAEWRRLGAIDKARNVVELRSAYAHASVLEIGAGEGSPLKQLADLKFASDLSALEISSSGLETIRRKGIEGLRDARLFDGYKVPYEDEQFDLIILSHVVEHVEHPRRLLAEASRVAKLVFVEVPVEDTLRMNKDYVFDSVGHINFYSPKTIRRLLQTSGLEVLAQRVAGSSRAVYLFQSGTKGVLTHMVKSAALAVAPSIAPHVFSYHSALLCRRTAR
jgi:SAM-dependent methyltransferase